MENATVVSVYGVPHGRRRERRIGSGTLQLTRLVVVDDPTEKQLASRQPPSIRRVGIGYLANGRPRVEVIEVRQVMRSSQQTGGSSWGLELLEESAAPTAAFTGTTNDAGQTSSPASLWCLLFPQASFCH